MYRLCLYVLIFIFILHANKKDEIEFCINKLMPTVFSGLYLYK